MTPIVTNLLKVISSCPPGVVSITGGGGKTTLLFSLARALFESGNPVICTTTTKMGKPEPADWLDIHLTETPFVPVAKTAVVYTAAPSRKEEPEKVPGFPPEKIDELAERCPHVWILNEADGAARLPLKAPATHEPVVPSSTVLSIAVVGLQCLVTPFSSTTVFRADEVSAITGLKEGDAVTPSALAELAVHPNGWFKNVPSGARRLVFCNQSDVPGTESAALACAQHIQRIAPGFLNGFFIGALETKGLECLSCRTA